MITIILSCTIPLSGIIFLVVVMYIVAIVRLQPLRCPKCGSLMHKYSNDKWYCPRCEKWMSALDIHTELTVKRLQKRKDNGKDN